MRKLTYLLLYLTALLLSLSAKADTLIEVIQRTLATNPEVLTTTHNRLAADERLRQAKAGYFPAVDVTAGYGRENSDNATTRSRYPSGDATLTRDELGLTLSQMLFDGFNVKNGIDKQQSKVTSAAYQVEDTSDNIALQTIETYLEILRRQEIVELNKDNIVIHQKIQDQIRTLVKGGGGRQADVQQTASRIALAESSLVNAQGMLRDAETDYLRVTGEEPKALVKPQADQFEKALPATLQVTFDTALNQHPSLRTAKAELEAAQADHQQTNANFMPRLNLELGVTKNKNLDGIEGKNDDIIAMVRMRYNLYRGGADQARRQETAEQVAAAKEGIRRTQRLIEEEVRRAWNSLLTIRARLQYLQQHVESTLQVVESYKEQFKLGQRSLLDVLDSENELFNARTALVTGQYTELLSIFRVFASMGLLLDTLGIKHPKEANLQ